MALYLRINYTVCITPAYQVLQITVCTCCVTSFSIPQVLLLWEIILHFLFLIVIFMAKNHHWKSPWATWCSQTWFWARSWIKLSLVVSSNLNYCIFLWLYKNWEKKKKFWMILDCIKQPSCNLLNTYYMGCGHRSF